LKLYNTAEESKCSLQIVIGILKKTGRKFLPVKSGILDASA